MNLSLIDILLAHSGLTLLGAFHPDPADGVPGFDLGQRGEATLILAGNAGPAMWQFFSAQRRSEDEPDPLDRWSSRTLTKIASELSVNSGHSVTALFPFEGPPYLPFQKWARRSGDVHSSPFGPMVHRRYGLWHAYRGALLIRSALDIPPATATPSACDGCAEKPCMSACPVAAFSTTGYDVPACVGHLDSGRGEDCFRLGCLARAACPVGSDYAYGEDHARFHLDKFLAAHRP